MFLGSVCTSGFPGLAWLVGINDAEPNPADWTELMFFARATGLSGRLAHRAQGLAPTLEPRVRDFIEAAGRMARRHATSAVWEARRVADALAELDIPVVLLKGAAYQVRHLSPSLGRYSSDVDVMVPHHALVDVERSLALAGWRPAQTDDYDQRYFRQWMHELPPMRHELRNTALDVHHTILAPTSRYNRSLNARLLFDASQPTGIAGLATLSDVDMVLHSATHRFTEGEHPFGLRDLIDLHDLVMHFGRDGGFWQRLVERAGKLHLGRPLYYGLRYCRLILGTDIPESAVAELDRFGPDWPARAAMDSLVPVAFLPGSGAKRPFADWCLYCRGHYLRMPWHLLVPHLARKWTGRLGGGD